MTGSEIITLLITAVTSALAGGGVVGRIMDSRDKRATDTTLDRQKLTEEVHQLYREANAALATTQKEVVAYERRIAGLERDVKDWERLATESDAEIAHLKATIAVVQRELDECRKGWSEWLKSNPPGGKPPPMDVEL